MKCLICKKEIKPFHIFKKKALFNKPVSKKGFGKTIDMALGYCKSCRHISSDAYSKTDWSEAEKTIYQKLYTSYTPIGLSPSQKKYTDFLSKWLSDLSPGGRVLEIGCYDGYFLNLFKKKKWLCRGVEPSPAAEIAQRKYGLEVIQDFFKPGQFKREKFDLVVIKHVIEHVPNPFEFTKEASLLVRKGGFLYIEIPNSYVSLHDTYFPEFHVDHLSYFTIPSIEKLIEKIGGFEIVKLESTWAFMKFPFIHLLIKKNSKKLEKKTYLIDYSIKNSIENFKEYYKVYLKNLREIAKKYQKIAIWGTGSCGTQFAIDGNFKKNKLVVVDPNPVNQNKYLTITAHRVYNPSILNKVNLDAILIASGWEDDVVKQISEYTNKKLNIIKFVDLLKF